VGIPGLGRVGAHVKPPVLYLDPLDLVSPDNVCAAAIKAVVREQACHRGAFLGLASFGWAVAFGVLATRLSYEDPGYPENGVDGYVSWELSDDVLRAALGES
jgi:hypothetical protein